MKTRKVRLRQWRQWHLRERVRRRQTGYWTIGYVSGYDWRLWEEQARLLRKRNARDGLWCCAICGNTYGLKTVSVKPVCELCLSFKPKWRTRQW